MSALWSIQSGFESTFYDCHFMFFTSICYVAVPVDRPYIFIMHIIVCIILYVHVQALYYIGIINKFLHLIEKLYFINPLYFITRVKFIHCILQIVLKNKLLSGGSKESC